MNVPILNDGKKQPEKVWYKLSPRVPQNPWSSIRTAWCTHCKGEMGVYTESHHRQGVYVYKRTCQRCGGVVDYGALNAPLVNATPLPAPAIQWVKAPGRDRR